MRCAIAHFGCFVFPSQRLQQQKFMWLLMLEFLLCLLPVLLLLLLLLAMLLQHLGMIQLSKLMFPVCQDIPGTATTT